MTKAKIFLDLNHRLATGGICASDYHRAIEQLQSLPESPQERLTITINENSGVRIDKPLKEPFSASQRFYMQIARVGLCGLVVLVLGLLQACGCLV